MPMYCYQEGETGRVCDFVFTIGKAPATFRHHGKLYTRCYQAEAVGVPAKSGWPMECVASGVNAAQAKELEAHLAGKGVPTQVSKDGNPIYLNAKHRRKALKARGMFDRAAYI